MSRNKEHRGVAFGGASNGAAAPLGLFFLSLLIHLFILCIFMDITYIFLFLAEHNAIPPLRKSEVEMQSLNACKTKNYKEH